MTLTPRVLRSWHPYYMKSLCAGFIPRASSRCYASVPAGHLRFGQPLHETHPHILEPGEVTPGISTVEYAHRRSALAAALPSNGVAVLVSANVKYRSPTVFYEFHQEPNFLYLTGFQEPESVAVIEKTGSGSEHKFHLFVRPKDHTAELWEGPRSGLQAAQDVFNADEAGDISSVAEALPKLLRAASVYTNVFGPQPPHSDASQYLLGCSSSRPEGLLKMLHESKAQPLQRLMNELRVIKSDAEIENMRRTGRASGRAITEAMRQSFLKEKDLFAFLDYRFKTHGCDGCAYVPVVAGGQNALSIHYVRNDDVLKNNDLVLVDAGGEYGGYITDITRTWPTGGRFSHPQKDLYEVVLTTQRKCVSLCRGNSNLSLDDLHEVAEQGLRDGLKGLGFDVSSDAMRVLFPHHVGHHVGLDVHDAPGYPRSSVYVPNEERWPMHFRGIGIRIEDSVCVREQNPFILTTEAVKEVVDIEALREY